MQKLRFCDSSVVKEKVSQKDSYPNGGVFNGDESHHGFRIRSRKSPNQNNI